jgi:di/tricarboxylate transporter
LSIEAWVTLAVIVGLVIALASGRVPASVSMLVATCALLFLGVIGPAEAFAGFANEAPIIIASLLVFARAVELSGVVQPVVSALLGSETRSSPLLARLLFPITAMSGFLNNTTVVAVTIPAILDSTTRQRVSPSRLLMPVSYAAVLGGVVTTIGTSTNLTVSGLLTSAGQAPLSLFELTPVGLPIAAVGCLLLVLTARRLLPERGSMRQAIEAGRDYMVVMRIVQGGPIDGLSVGQAGLRHLEGVFLVQIERDGRQIAPVAPEDLLEGNDLLTFAGRVDQIVDLHRMRGLESAERRHFDALTGSQHAFFEVVVGEALAAGNPTLAEVGFRGRYGGAVVAIHRAGQRIDAKLGEVGLRLGDTLVVLADLGFHERWRDSRDFLLIAPLRGVPPTQPRKLGRVVAIGVGFVVLTGLGIVPLLHGALAAALLVVGMRVITIQQAREAIDLNIVILVAAAFGMGAAVESSGLGAAVASVLVGAFEPLGLIGILAGILLATMALTELISNNAAAVLMFPIALAAAATTGSDPRPFVVALTLGASLSFLSPIGYQTNLMVYGVGGYRFTDFTRLGLPLTFACFVLTLILVPLVFPF